MNSPLKSSSRKPPRQALLHLEHGPFAEQLEGDQ